MSWRGALRKEEEEHHISVSDSAVEVLTETALKRVVVKHTPLFFPFLEKKRFHLFF